MGASYSAVLFCRSGFHARAPTGAPRACTDTHTVFCHFCAAAASRESAIFWIGSISRIGFFSGFATPWLAPVEESSPPPSVPPEPFRRPARDFLPALPP